MKETIKLERTLTEVLIICPHCQKVHMCQQTGKEKYWCSKTNRSFVLKED
ncbi:MAG: hypothetical protein LLF82_000334 [Dehalococcoides mccartyi]|nr:hypothetical protein [Dehalococcoides mccartyi]